ncbi:MAG: hypothetical protein ACYS47_11890 [Planctomycetota bacterium]
MSAKTKILCLIVAAGFLLGPVVLPGTLLSPEAEGAEGKLRGLESKLRGKSPSIKKKTRLSKSEGLLVYFLVDFLVNIAPYLLFPRHRFHYQDFPYADGEGYPVFFGDSPYASPDTVPLATRQVAFELRGEYQVDSPELHGYRVYGKARLSWAFNVDADVTQFREWRNLYVFDTLTFIKVDGLFNISNSPWHDLDLGFGVSYLDGVDLFAGLNAKLTGDIFPHRPLGIHFAACANAFSGGVLYETEFAVGVFLRRFEFRLGWRALWVGDIEIHGPMTGLAIWF